MSTVPLPLIAGHSGETTGDFTTTLPSGLIADIVEAYFNKSMFKRPVRVVDLHLQGDMCLFSLAWAPKEGQVKTALTALSSITHSNNRDRQGRFTNRERQKES